MQTPPTPHTPTRGARSSGNERCAVPSLWTHSFHLILTTLWSGVISFLPPFPPSFLLSSSPNRMFPSHALPLLLNYRVPL